MKNPNMTYGAAQGIPLQNLIDELQTGNLPSPSIEQFYDDFNNRTIWLLDEIDGDTGESRLAWLLLRRHLYI